MQLTGDKWVIVYTHPDKGRTEAIVKAGQRSLRVIHAAEVTVGGYGVTDYALTSTRDAQGRRVYA